MYQEITVCLFFQEMIEWSINYQRLDVVLLCLFIRGAEVQAG